MLFSGIPRVRLIEEATPLERLQNIGVQLGHPGIYMKRDDLIPLGMGGNKVRCLEFWLGEALRQNADVILVAGEPVSNQCRLTAAAAAKIGMRCVILHSSSRPESYGGNALLNHIMGTETVFLGEIGERERKEKARQYADALRSQGHRPYIVGADPALGALGYVNSALELAGQAEQKNIDLQHVFICGSEGITETGLLYGLSLFGKSFKLHIVSVEYETDRLKSLVRQIYAGICRKLNYTPASAPEDIVVFHGDYLGGGYAKATRRSLAAVRFLARREAIFIENTYNAKVFAGMIDLVEKGAIESDAAVCCYHTGGAPALFGQSELFE